MSLGNADVVLFAMIFVSTLIGLFRGLFREAFSLFVWGASLFVAYTFAGVLEPVVARMIDNRTMAFPLAMVVLFVLCLVLGNLGQRLGASLISNTGLGGLDRALGMAFGAARGAVVAIVLLIALRPFFGDSAWWQESRIITGLLAFESVVLQGLQSLTGRLTGLVG